MTYSIFILRRAQKELSRLPDEGYVRVREIIRSLALDPRPVGSAKLRGRDGWRVRVGDYRVIYDIADGDKTVTVLHVGRRKDIYAHE